MTFVRPVVEDSAAAASEMTLHTVERWVCGGSGSIGIIIELNSQSGYKCNTAWHLQNEREKV